MAGYAGNSAMCAYANHASHVVQAARGFYRLARAFSRAYGADDSSAAYCRQQARERMARLRQRRLVYVRLARLQALATGGHR